MFCYHVRLSLAARNRIHRDRRRRRRPRARQKRERPRRFLHQPVVLTCDMLQRDEGEEEGEKELEGKQVKEGRKVRR